MADLTKDQISSLKEIIKHLKELGGGRKPKDRFSGICAEMYQYAPSPFLCEMIVYFSLWPKGSGNPLYPVLHPTMSARDAVVEEKVDHWKGEYGQSRRELCRYAAGRLEEKYKKELK